MSPGELKRERVILTQTKRPHLERTILPEEFLSIIHFYLRNLLTTLARKQILKL